MSKKRLERPRRRSASAWWWVQGSFAISGRTLMRLGFVVPRYGPEIVGGAETLARAFAEHLPRERFEVEVLTTCALDHHSWTNVLPAGDCEIDGVRVRRFPVSPRDVARFLEVQGRISAGLRVGVEEELAWAAGSVNSAELYRCLREEHRAYDALVFLPYLFGTTLLGTQIDPGRSLLVPCLHDEPFAYTRVVRRLFRSVRGFLFNSVPERALAERLFGVGAGAPVVGVGFETRAPDPAAAAAFRRRSGLDGDYLLYFGRKEGGKNLPLLLDCYRACRGAGDGLGLVVAGDGRIDGEPIPGLVDLPRLDEDEKRAACAGALAVCQPSTNESFSIVLMEAWLAGRPALVHGACAVTRFHAREAGGGLWFESPREFAAEVDWLRTHRDEAAAIGRQGHDYVVANYGWDRVLARFESGLGAVLGA
jgi:glycosyltransferase involved in cell wall biosynthesis